MSKVLIDKISYFDNKFEFCQQIRNQVFVVEQGVDPKLEMDLNDKKANHYLLSVNGVEVGTCRWRVTDQGIKLERFAILKEYRNLGYGSEIVKSVLKDAMLLNKTIYLNSQINALNFYQNLGFETEGSAFMEADIYHYRMIFKA
jgi:predicted GNAT family N-acyltransferase